MVWNKLTFDELNKRLKENTTLELLEINGDKYRVKCSVCKQEHDANRRQIVQTKKCSVCDNKLIINGYNDINTTANWMVKYLKDKNDAFKYMSKSNKKIIFKCPNCGYEKESTPNTIYYEGFGCKMCGDKISQPNKFARAVLKRLHLDNLIFEYVSDWTDNKKYDAYFEYNNEKYVLEMDGGLHFKDTAFATYEEQKRNDEYKNNLAEKNKINIIRIKFPTPNNYDIPINDFKKSILGELINQYNINWNDCILESQRSILVDVCNYYNDGHVIIKDIANKFNLATNTVDRYLTQGKKLGICNYDIIISKENSKNAVRELANKRIKKIIVEDINTNLKHEYENKEECSKVLNIPVGTIKTYCQNEMVAKGLKFYFKNEIPFKERAVKDPKFYIVCDYANEHIDDKITDFSKRLHVNPARVTSFLKLGIEMGICHYSFELADKKRTDKMVKTKQRNNILTQQ